MLEPETIRRLTPRIIGDRLDRADELIAAMDDEHDAARWAQLNYSFHELVVDAVSSKRLRAMIRSLQDSAAAYIIRALDRHIDRRDHNEQHRQIVGALRDRDGDRAAAEVAVHLRDTLAALLRLTEEDHGRSEPTPSDLTVIDGHA
jgi:DNA-binding GntR family transcriptional regulator